MNDFLKDIIKETGNEYASLVADGVEAGVYDSKYDDKVFGTYFIVEVEHTFKKNNYTNSLIGVKTYLFENPDITEVV